MKAIPYVFKAFAIDAPHAQVRFLKDRKAMMSRGCPEVYPLKIYRHQVLNGLIKLPWAVKPMIGLTSDVLPVMGFRKAESMNSNLHSVLVEFVSRCIGLDNVEADLKPNMNCLFYGSPNAGTIYGDLCFQWVLRLCIYHHQPSDLYHRLLAIQTTETFQAC